ncbi:MAG: response regulator receiver protein [Sulfuricurvum sp. PC08-66]|nr:MAG: response regulator receiver protein [Sulfuricurvum sp. PC08-66]
MSLMENVNSVTKLAENNEVQLMVFKTGMEKDAPFYAINVFKTREAIESKKHYLTQIPGAHPLLEGTISLRGSLVPIIDLPRWLGAGLTKEQKNASKFLICDFNGIMIGLRISYAHRIIKKNWQDLHSPDSYAVSDTSKVVNDTRLESGEICLVLDYEKLLSEVIPEAMVDTDNTYDIEDMDIPEKLRKGKVLIAEDSKTAQKHLRKIFEHANLSCIIFPNGKELLEYIDEMEDPSIIPAVITDLEMPEVSGFTVVKQLRSSDRTKRLPIIINSSMTGTSNKRDAERLGASAFIDKTKSDRIIPLIIEVMNEAK